MKKLIGVFTAVFFVLFLNGSVFASELPIEEITDQGMQAAPDSSMTLGEEATASESQTPSDLEGAAIPEGAEAPLTVWGSSENQASTGPTGQTSPIDSVKVDLSVDADGQTFMPLNE